MSANEVAEAEWADCKGGMTAEQAVEGLRSDVAKFVDKVSEVLPAGMSQHQFDAAVILSQNIGEGAFAGSSAAAPINNPGATTP